MSTLDALISEFKASLKVVPNPQPQHPWPTTPIGMEHYRLGVREVQGPQDQRPRRVLSCDLIPECFDCVGGLDRETLTRCRCFDAQKRAREVEASGLPAIARKRTRGTINPGLIHNLGEIGDAIDRWRAGDYPGLIFTGVTGSAKTHIAQALILEEALDAGNRVHYAVWPELALKFKSVYQENRSPYEHLARFERAQVFALDEIGGDKLSDWTLQWLMQIINHAEDTEQRFVLTTNLTDKELAQWADDRLASRLHYMCRGVTIQADDFRRL